jgi:serine/threonine-protein kinase
MAVVYEAIDPELNRRVALKVLAEHLMHDTAFVARFRAEAQAAAALSHPNIVTIYEVGQDGANQYIAMEYLESDLDAVLEQRGALSVEETVAIVLGVASGLEAAHGKGIVHRDIKPSNIMFDALGRPKIVDFGIVRMLEGARLTRMGMSVGTPEYMSPEQASGGSVDHRTDIYSLGIVMYEMLTGRVPFAATTPLAIAYMHRHEYPPDVTAVRGDVPQWLLSVLATALAKDPAARYQSPGELVRALPGQRAPSWAAEARVLPKPDRLRAYAGPTRVVAGPAPRSRRETPTRPTPAVPEAPVYHAEPAQPVPTASPALPPQAAEPVEAQPVELVAPVLPPEAAQASEPTEPVDLAGPAGATEPAELAPPAGPVELAERGEAADLAEPTGAPEHVDAAEPPEPTEPAAPAELTEPVALAEPPEPVDLAEPAEPVKPTEPAELAQLAEPSEAAATTTKPAPMGASSGTRVPASRRRRVILTLAAAFVAALTLDFAALYVAGRRRAQPQPSNVAVVGSADAVRHLESAPPEPGTGVAPIAGESSPANSPTQTVAKDSARIASQPQAGRGATVSTRPPPGGGGARGAAVKAYTEPRTKSPPPGGGVRPPGGANDGATAGPSVEPPRSPKRSEAGPSVEPSRGPKRSAPGPPADPSRSGGSAGANKAW